MFTPGESNYFFSLLEINCISLGVDDVQSECDLDDVKVWDMELVNNSDPQSLIEEILANLF